MIHERLNATALVLQLPWGVEGDFTGVIDLVQMKGLLWANDDKTSKGDVFDVVDIPAEFTEQAAEWRHKMIEALADNDDAVMEKYLDEQELSVDEIKAGIRRAILGSTTEHTVTAVLCGSAFKNKGVQPMLDAVVDYLPSPLDIGDDQGCLGTRRHRRGRPRPDVRRAVLRAGLQDPDRPARRQADLHPGLLGHAPALAPRC